VRPGLMKTKSLVHPGFDAHFSPLPLYSGGEGG
jgi:hypothetical protein